MRPDGALPQRRRRPVAEGGGDCMDAKMARERLEEIRTELDRSIMVLNASGGQQQWSGDYPQDPADAGANLSESERSEAVLASARRQRSDVQAALGRLDVGT